MTNFDKYRHNVDKNHRLRREIDLVALYNDTFPSQSASHEAIEFLLSVMQITPIVSRQAAAIAVATAKHIGSSWAHPGANEV